MTAAAEIANDDLDLHVDEELKKCLDPQAPQSFFLFAGAGSGKTRSLIAALDHLRSTMGGSLRMRGQKVAVITYTKAARDEIIRRTQFDSVIVVSTIHSFAWTLIEGFNHDIREWLRVALNDDILDLQVKEAKGRAGTKASSERLADIASKQRRLARLDTTKKFVYSPDSDNRGWDSLNHAEVLKLAGDFVQTKPTLRQILRDGYPYILVDESQDTNRHILEALFTFQAAHKSEVVVGLFGDMMQRIYGDGQPGLGENLPADWATPTKRLNFRCPRRVIELINKVREATDKQAQIPCSVAQEGHVRMFVFPSEGTDKAAAEEAICAHMAGLTTDGGWLDEDAVKVLILEHRMAALRMGFDDLLAALYPIAQFRTALLDGTLPLVNFFSNLILPLWDAKDDKFGIARIVREASPLASASALKNADDQFKQLAKAQAGVDALVGLLDGNPAVTFSEVVQNVAETGLFEIPDLFKVVLAGADIEVADNDGEEERTDRDKGVAAFLAVPFGQVRAYAKYVGGKARFDTHQGVKGLEFPRVMVIMDDREARGFLFKYDKLFGGGAEDNQTASTRRLFYVTCSRAERSLALVAYAERPEYVRNQLLMNGWFKPEEIFLGLP
ncbi:UvrD-helicase domain-containing protein [Castellaniella sp. GW247-6E4]|uniref:UvrD-helicase domain-containing protein n=1 Tax=Castellaniella sp. GW247-6E4 TaxID=3140380 RepID=UPI003314F68F